MVRRSQGESEPPRSPSTERSDDSPVIDEELLGRMSRLYRSPDASELVPLDDGEALDLSVCQSDTAEPPLIWL